MALTVLIFTEGLSKTCLCRGKGGPKILNICLSNIWMVPWCKRKLGQKPQAPRARSWQKSCQFWHFYDFNISYKKFIAWRYIQVGTLLLTDIILDYFSELTACAASNGLPSTSVGGPRLANKFTLIQNSWDQSVKLDSNPQFKVKLFWFRQWLLAWRRNLLFRLKSIVKFSVIV